MSAFAPASSSCFFASSETTPPVFFPRVKLLGAMGESIYGMMLDIIGCIIESWWSWHLWREPPKIWWVDHQVDQVKIRLEQFCQMSHAIATWLLKKEQTCFGLLVLFLHLDNRLFLFHDTCTRLALHTCLVDLEASTSKGVVYTKWYQLTKHLQGRP